MSKKIKLAGALLGAVITTSTMAYAGETAKCGSGKCGSDMNTTKSISHKCGSDMNTTKSISHKCGSEMKSENSEMKSSKCGSGKCGS